MKDQIRLPNLVFFWLFLDAELISDVNDYFSDVVSIYSDVDFIFSHVNAIFSDVKLNGSFFNKKWTW